MYSVPAVECVRLLFPFLLQSLAYLLPHLAAAIRVEPDQLLLSCVDDVDAAPGTFDVNEGQADGDDFVRVRETPAPITSRSPDIATLGSSCIPNWQSKLLGCDQPAKD